ncbi:MAG: efflux RND transporter periplasmic adaptor subunit [Acidiferrobacteraceae bacterium]
MAVTRKQRVFAAVIVALVAMVIAGYRYRQDVSTRTGLLTIYGNTDIRQIQLAFDDSGRVALIPVQEGDRVRKGELLARLDDVRFKDQVAQAEGALTAARQVLARLVAGSRPEEILEARAQVAGARAIWQNAQITYHRERALAAARYVPQQASDNAARTLAAAFANWERAVQALRLAVKGPRREDIAAARARTVSDAAVLALARRALADTRLYAPADGVIENRILEPGDMANPKIPVLTLALDNPVWVRAYLPERSLGWVHPGMKAGIESDSFPGKSFAGWIGFISPTAEFTPKTVETTQLRTALVYRVRVYACNPDGQLRLGMPVTVTIALSRHPARRPPGRPCGP